jgi:antirestriction protein
MSHVTYYELSNYNNGNYISKTFDLADVDYDEHLQEVSSWLNELTLSTGILCEEKIIADCEGVPQRYVGDWAISREFFDYKEALSSSNLEEDAFNAGVCLDIPLDEIDEKHVGWFRDDSEIGEYFLENLEDLSSIPPNLIAYIDTEKYGRDISMDLSSHNKHYFWS